MTLAEAARDALTVQDACNLSGVARAFVAALDAVWEESRRQNAGTDFVNRHPITRLYVDKLVSLAGEAGASDYERVREIALGYSLAANSDILKQEVGRA